MQRYKIKFRREEQEKEEQPHSKVKFSSAKDEDGEREEFKGKKKGLRINRGKLKWLNKKFMFNKSDEKRAREKCLWMRMEREREKLGQLSRSIRLLQVV